MNQPWFRVLGLGAAGAALSGLFSGVLGFGRDTMVLAYTIGGCVMLLTFYRPELSAVAQGLRQQWRRGLVSGLALGAVLTVAVLRQPPSEAPTGWRLPWAIVWLGLVYGTLDGLLLNAAPVLAVTHGQPPRLSGRPGEWRRGALALAASLFVTAAYHLGYVEYHGPQLLQPLIGNAVMTASYLATGNVATPLLGHVIMHAAAVLHGMETTSQLPPHS